MRVGVKAPTHPQNFVGVMAADYGLELTLIQLTNERQVNNGYKCRPTDSDSVSICVGRSANSISLLANR